MGSGDRLGGGWCRWWNTNQTQANVLLWHAARVGIQPFGSFGSLGSGVSQVGGGVGRR
jgi:hypothetical protein